MQTALLEFSNYILQSLQLDCSHKIITCSTKYTKMKWINRNSIFKAPRRKASHLPNTFLEQVPVFSWHKSCPVNPDGHFKEFSPNSITESIKAVYITVVSFQRHPFLNLSICFQHCSNKCLISHTAQQ